LASKKQPTPKTSTKRSGGIDINGDVDAKGDLVGRDKIIHNIVIVGQMLDLASIEGLLPKNSDLPDFQTIAAAFESTFNSSAKVELANAAAAAGEILKPILSEWMPKTLAGAMPYKIILPRLAESLFEKLKRLKYWDAFHEDIPSQEWPGDEHANFKYLHIKVIWLDSLSSLWKKHYQKYNEMPRFGIIDLAYMADGHRFEGEQGFVAHYPSETRIKPLDSNYFMKFGSEEFRLFMSGLVLDLIRLVTLAQPDVKFMQGLMDSLAPQKKQ
jgi:hypothetical protein